MSGNLSGLERLYRHLRNLLLRDLSVYVVIEVPSLSGDFEMEKLGQCTSEGSSAHGVGKATRPFCPGVSYTVKLQSSRW